MITPDLVWKTRADLGLSTLVLARVIGVQTETVEAWEMARGPVQCLASSETILRALAQAAQAARNPAKLGHAMTEAAINHGPMAALYLALHAIYWRTAPKQEPAK
ncbi:MAG: hypothetical protein IPP14_11640 [Planctomycetes bacterium]|nr:hypothetical protein [Planctomycetota bacterium]